MPCCVNLDLAQTTKNGPIDQDLRVSIFERLDATCSVMSETKIDHES